LIKKKFATPITLKSVYRPHNHILRTGVGGAFHSRFATCIAPFLFHEIKCLRKETIFEITNC